MIDQRLRASKDRLLAPAARFLPRRIPAGALTVMSMISCVAAGVVAAADMRLSAVALWLAGRLLDGLDGTVARLRTTESDLGGYFDLIADTIGYAAVPIGIAVGRGDDHVWAACAVLLATFSVNTMSWTYISAVAAKRATGAGSDRERTSIHMPTGLIEGTETIVLFTLMLAVPNLALGWFIVMSVLVAATVLQRSLWVRANLR